ncbi:hypothetical protein BH11MYX3_BH11MYX3_20980 [soil metagenome]
MLMISHATGARDPIGYRRFFEAIVGALPVPAILFVPIPATSARAARKPPDQNRSAKIVEYLSGVSDINQSNTANIRRIATAGRPGVASVTRRVR